MRGAAIMALVLLVACSQEPAFDERFDTAQDDIEQRADKLAAELEAQAPPQDTDGAP